MSNAEAVNQALVAANAAQLEGFGYTQKALLGLARDLQKTAEFKVSITQSDQYGSIYEPKFKH